MPTTEGPRACSIASALEIVGERWSLLVIREVLSDVHRFERIRANTGAPRDVLTKRLVRLVDAGVIERKQYSEHPPRFEYHATEAGLQLQPVLAGLAQWSRAWLPDLPQSEPYHHDCGHPLTAQLVCEHCKSVIAAPGADDCQDEASSGGGVGTRARVSRGRP